LRLARARSETSTEREALDGRTGPKLQGRNTTQTFLTRYKVLTQVFNLTLCRIGDYNQRAAAADRPLDSRGAPLSRFFFK
jgi:hypothetical protein